MLSGRPGPRAAGRCAAARRPGKRGSRLAAARARPRRTARAVRRAGVPECPETDRQVEGPGEGQGPDVGPYPPGVRVRTARLREHASAEVDARDPALAQGFQDPHARAWWPILPVSCPGESGP